LPKGDYVISIATGFMNETFARNTIEQRESAGGVALVLTGNHFGTKILRNHFIGSGAAYKLTAAPTEHPLHWGWSHAPFVGCTIDGNTVEDSVAGGILCVEHSQYMKSTRGRVYLSASFKNNRGVWTQEFLRSRAKSEVPPPFTIGHEESKEPGEMLVTESGNRIQAPPEGRSRVAIRIHSAQVNGRPVKEQGIVLPPADGDSVGTSSQRTRSKR
jgi:hypothetical protein